MSRVIPTTDSPFGRRRTDQASRSPKPPPVGFGEDFRRFFLRGLAALLPTLITLSLLWWIWSDKSGLDKRREMEKMEQRKENRRRENLERMGLNFRSYGKNKKKEQAIVTAREREIERIEGKRTEKRRKIRDSILGSRVDSKTPGQSGFPSSEKGKR